MVLLLDYYLNIMGFVFQQVVNGQKPHEKIIHVAGHGLNQIVMLPLNLIVIQFLLV